MRNRKAAPLKRVCVFSASRDGLSPRYKELASELGHALSDAHLGLVYGGINRGLMGAVADAVIQRGGEAIGVVPRKPFPRDWRHRGLSKLHVVRDLHTRQARMLELADAFITLPGGFGTLEEFFEIVLLAQLGVHRKPMILLNIDHYFDPLADLIAQMTKEGFLAADPEPNILYETEINAAIRDIQRICLGISEVDVLA